MRFISLLIYFICPLFARADINFDFLGGRPSAATGYFVGNYVTYHDVQSDGSSEKQRRPDAYSAELGFRIINVFNLGFTGLQSIDGNDSAYGIIGRVHVPGFFFLWGKQSDLNLKSRDRPINTSFFVGAQYHTEEIEDATAASKIENYFGLTLDIFLVGGVFMTGSAFTSNYGNDYFIATSAGLGFEF